MSNTDFKIIVCAAIHNREGKILLAQRKSGKVLGGFWEFPGGKLEHGEGLEMALKREITEELEIEIDDIKLLHIKPHVYDHGAVLILFYLSRFKSGTITLKDHDAIKWCEVSEIQDHNLLPANEEMIAILKNLKKI